ncbi:tRNA (adenosine(37)-N6)-threonylcarbamoyltransferase complex dimerization subunit type 1 TsaB [Jannaschia ovalis]|uniref:tRNA (Adenosine(37)-N6)-threonylcarbamoyltransferase complex dimerization subunit type 1 TsaB n=1 Tax=Jannaschia ovalis TaxID=3038773 RepID=A0ABY8LFH5_9RHOB|nr:tRNA (adenosine(37)-N6)-threonylcarbamoyltransferase complex dimerization subunit type 1 TsaB [Jannaschia sp. GRR-S6-38]WGH80048.1 tRNA (adenosine(37)-N6)-threonylcarbamoyltransferase complex dimerization subunit type 1 TsaB [Jannaschia sp. GRR-S6-38]
MATSDRLSLGFDTSAAHCAAALVSGDRILAERVEAMRKGQAERLMPLLEDLLAVAGHRWADLDCIGVGTGPGNFTGIRIAVAAARGLALGLGIPAHGVTGPEALGGGRDVIVCLPAPQGAVHAARGDDIRRLTAADWPADWRAPLTGPAAPELAAALGLPLAETPALAPAIARLAARRATPGGARPAPLYLRPADAAPPADQPPAIL